MKKFILVSIALVCLATAVFLSRDFFKPSGESLKNGAAPASVFAPDFNLRDMEGRHVRLSDFRGKKAALLVFSTTWCPHCRKQVSEINEIYSRYNDKGLEVFHIDIEEPPDRIAAFIKRYKVQYPVLLDRSGKVGEQYRIVGVPTNVLVDKAGKIVCNPCSLVEKTIPSLLN